MLKRKLTVAVNNGQLSKVETDKFVKHWAFWLLIPCAILWVLQLSSGANSNASFMTWPLLQMILGLSVQLFVWGALTYYVFIKDGASTLSKYLRISEGILKPFYSALAIKAATILVLLAGIASLLKSFLERFGSF